MYVSADYDNIEPAQTGLEKLQRLAVQMGGYAVVMDAPQHWRASLDLWGVRPETRHLMRRLKRVWDPAGLLDSALYRLVSDAFGEVKDYSSG